MLFRDLVNFGLVFLFIAISYSFFYFEVIPELINHYRRVKRKNKIYEQQVHDIKESE